MTDKTVECLYENGGEGLTTLTYQIYAAIVNSNAFIKAGEVNPGGRKFEFDSLILAEHPYKGRLAFNGLQVGGVKYSLHVGVHDFNRTFVAEAQAPANGFCHEIPSNKNTPADLIAKVIDSLRESMHINRKKAVVAMAKDAHRKFVSATIDAEGDPEWSHGGILGMDGTGYDVALVTKLKTNGKTLLITTKAALNGDSCTIKRSIEEKGVQL